LLSSKKRVHKCWWNWQFFDTWHGNVSTKIVEQNLRSVWRHVGIAEALARWRWRDCTHAFGPRHVCRKCSVWSRACQLKLAADAVDFVPLVGAVVGRDVALRRHRGVGLTQSGPCWWLWRICRTVTRISACCCIWWNTREICSVNACDVNLFALNRLKEVHESFNYRFSNLWFREWWHRISRDHPKNGIFQYNIRGHRKKLGRLINKLNFSSIIILIFELLESGTSLLKINFVLNILTVWH